jgi:hypothetical protein
LFIPSFALSVNQLYTFTLTTTVTVGGATTSTPSSASFFVHPSDLDACVRGGDRFISVNEEVVLDGTCSSDPEFVFAFLFLCSPPVFFFSLFFAFSFPPSFLLSFFLSVTCKPR